jgi:hypothetical protein
MIETGFNLAVERGAALRLKTRREIKELHQSKTEWIHRLLV